ncbi:MAG: aminotransferase class I/II-fold pyridoxal phosphate-dependent enzyme [Balneolales bacterium]|nr:aminotransferase class I/II-fold pyridoxal phosphate-dependent enzyme [Balneolales bacterium]
MFSELLPFLERWFKEAEIKGYGIPSNYGSINSPEFSSHLEQVFVKFAERMKGNYPFHHPDYAGQMLKPPHPVAWLAYSMAMSVNTNNHALDGGPPTSEMEKESVAALATMFGYGKSFLGHLTSGGTVANLEALWVASCIHPGRTIAFSDQAHYTHERMCGVLRIPSAKIKSYPSADESPELFASRLESVLKKSNVGTLVVTMGTTGTGRVEPLHLILPVCKKLGVRVHLDAAYGGFFKLLAQRKEIESQPWNVTNEADSIVIDPHKHGLQPYGCGCVLFKDPAVGSFYKHDSPYTYFSSDELHLGEITLECSRAGAAAAALWFTIEMFGLDYHNSEFVNMLSACRAAALSFGQQINETQSFKLLEQPQTDIVCYFPIASDGETISALSKALFSDLMKRGSKSLFLSLYKVPAASVLTDKNSNDTEITVLRSVFMKPSHKEFVPILMQRLNESLQRVKKESF